MSNKEVNNEHGGLSAIKRHFSVLTKEAPGAAVKD